MNRATLYANVDALLKYSRDVHSAPTNDLFDSRESKLALEIKPVEDWPLATKLWMERKALGTWVSGHPMQLVAGKYEHKARHKVREIDDLLSVYSGGPYYFAFIVIEVLRSKTGKVVILKIEDETGRGELAAFATDCDPWWHLLKKDYILIAQCVPKHNMSFSSMHFVKLHKLGQLTRPSVDAKSKAKPATRGRALPISAGPRVAR